MQKYHLTYAFCRSLACIIALWLGFLSTENTLDASAAPSGSPGTIALREGKLSVQLAGAPLWQILVEVSRLTNARVVWLHGEGREEQVSVEFTDLPLAEGLERILQHKNFVLFFAQTPIGTRLTQIWVSADRATVQPPVIQLAASITHPSRETKGTTAESDKSTLTPVGAVMQQVMEMAKSESDPSTRANAVVYLEMNAQDDPQVRGTLEQIAHDDTNVRVKKMAAEALQRIESTPSE